MQCYIINQITFTIHNVHYTVYTTQRTLYILLHYTANTTQCTLYCVVVYTTQYTLHSVHFTVHTTQCTLHRVQYTAHSVHFKLYTILQFVQLIDAVQYVLIRFRLHQYGVSISASMLSNLAGGTTTFDGPKGIQLSGCVVHLYRTRVWSS